MTLFCDHTGEEVASMIEELKRTGGYFYNRWEGIKKNSNGQYKVTVLDEFDKEFIFTENTADKAVIRLLSPFGLEDCETLEDVLQSIEDATLSSEEWEEIYGYDL